MEYDEIGCTGGDQRGRASLSSFFGVQGGLLVEVGSRRCAGRTAGVGEDSGLVGWWLDRARAI